MKITKKQLNILIENLLFEEEEDNNVKGSTNQPAYKRNIKREISNLISVIESETKDIDTRIRKGLVTALKGVQQKSDALIDKGDKAAIKKLIDPIYGQFQGYKRDRNIPAAAAKKFNDQFKVIAKEISKLEPSKGKKQASTRKGNKDVKAIQQALNDAGYTGKDGKSPLVVDGIFGKRDSNTDYAYQNFIQTNYKNNNKIHFVTGLGKGATKSKLHTSNIGNNGWRWGDVVDLINDEGNDEVKGKYEKNYKGMLAFINDVEDASSVDPKQDMIKKWKSRLKGAKNITSTQTVSDLAAKLTGAGLSAKFVYDHDIAGAPSQPTTEIDKASIAAKFKKYMSSTENITYGGTDYPKGTIETSFTYNPSTKVLIIDTMYGDYYINNVDFIPAKGSSGTGLLIAK